MPPSIGTLVSSHFCAGAFAKASAGDEREERESHARSRSTRCAALWPAAPMTEPAGCVPAEHEYSPATGVAYGKRSAKPNELSTWWMCPRVMPK